MNTYNLILKRRTIRKFQQKKLPKQVLLDCLNAARLAPSGANRQPLEYILVAKNLESVFNCTHWAGYLDNSAPQQNEEPMAYIIILSHKKINPEPKYDVGFAAENIILTALEKEIAGCVIGSLDKAKLAKILDIPESYTVELVIALGYPKQKSVAEESKGELKYWLDEKNVLHVPKRRLKDILHEEKF
ncbi:nitroreductase family protein [Patescibacteria group bacterium]|nr:nitroreductase family protein [Patescibacteria group bacterium]MBU4512264.1 nitroreductase family protein [Patescibacteria group bacterium]MCG2692940.1 nitroreductase family protein [Candidatus Parcubacteria bacterium]